MALAMQLSLLHCSTHLMNEHILPLKYFAQIYLIVSGNEFNHLR